MAYNEFDVMFGFDDLKKVEKFDLSIPFEDALWAYEKPSSDASKNITPILRKAFVQDILGNDPFFQRDFRVAETPASNPIEAAMNMYFAKGVAGGELKRKVQKGGLDISEGMSALLTKFQEFFTIAEQGQLKRQIACLDVPGFLEMLNSKLEAA